MNNLLILIRGFIIKLLIRAINIFGLILSMGGIALAMFQVFLYLKNGEWVRFHFLDVCIVFTPNKIALWLENPSSWLGLHKIIHSVLDFIPISLFALSVGIGLAEYEIPEDKK